MSRNETSIPDPEVVPTAKRRRFTTQEKVRILKEADACTEPGELGALLRREGIYSSYLSRWRRARDRGELQALSPKRRGPKSAADSGLTKELVKLQRENERLRGRLAQAEAIMEAQKKLSELLGLSPGETGNDE
jgi:transposase